MVALRQCMAHNFFSIHTTMEGRSSWFFVIFWDHLDFFCEFNFGSYWKLKFILLHYATDSIKQSNDSKIDIIKDNVAFLCDLDGAHYLQCTLVLNISYSDVIMKLIGNDSNKAVKGINICNTRVVHNEDESLNFAADEKIITQKFSINSTCPSDNIIISKFVAAFFYANSCFSNLSSRICWKTLACCNNHCCCCRKFLWNHLH